MHLIESTHLKHTKAIEAKTASSNDSLFASTRRNLRQPTSIISPRNRKSKIKNRKSRFGVTVVEVLFAMFVILFGLVGLAAIIPMAARQASDSYAMVQGSAAMQNTQAAARSQKGYLPSIEKQWWYANDLSSDLSNNPNLARFRAYVSFSKISELLDLIQIPTEADSTAFASLNFQQQNIVRRKGLATGFCIDPQFCGDQFLNNVDGSWRYSPTNYNHFRNANLLFRRTRMPFFDESTILSGNSFISDSAANFPRLLRVSFASGMKNLSASAAFPNILIPCPLQKSGADLTATSGGDLLQADVQEDKSAGALRNFQMVSSGALQGQMISSSVSGTVSWLACLTPSEETPPGVIPTSYKVSVVIFDRRENQFEAVPLTVSGAEKFPRGERLAFVTSVLPTGAAAPLIGAGSPVGHLPFTGNSGSMQVALHSDALTDTRLRVGDWVMLSRQIETGNLFVANPPINAPVANVDALEYKMTHRHRWYRVTGVDNSETWPRIVRLQGPTWEYEELQIDSSGNQVVTPTSVVPIYGRKIDGGFDRRFVTTTTDLRSVATTAAIFANVVAVYQFDVSVE